MKFILATTAMLIASTNAFAPTGTPSFSRPSVALNLQRGDDSSAVQEALVASRMYGPSSKQARVAWDIVEEIRASDNSAAFVQSPHDVLADPTQNKDKYEQFLQLKDLAELQKEHIDNVKHVTTQIRAVRLAPPSKSDQRIHNPILDHALTEAKLMTEKHGIKSSQARLAWETLEDIAGDDLSEAMRAAIDSDEECLVEMIQACEALDELNRALFLTENKEAGRYQG